MKQIVVCVLCVFALFDASAQYKKKKPKNSYAQGTLFAYWGYNRSFYSKSNIHFEGAGYDFDLKGVRAADSPEGEFANYVNRNAFELPQFNARIGYYFKNNWAISVGYDHLKYVMLDKNDVLLNGTIADGTDTSSFQQGSYFNQAIVTDRSTFHYENTHGLNYIRLELTRTDQWFKVRRSEWFAFSTNMSIGAGPLLSNTNFRFGGNYQEQSFSLSGYGVSASLGARFEFFKHFFVQGNAGGGLMHQVRVKTRNSDVGSFARHAFGFTQLDAVVGVLLYIRPTNDCNSCPHW